MALSREQQVERTAAFLLSRDAEEWVTRQQIAKAVGEPRDYHLILGAAQHRSVTPVDTWFKNKLIEIDTTHRAHRYKLTARGRKSLQHYAAPSGDTYRSGPKAGAVPTSKKPPNLAAFSIEWANTFESFEIDLDTLEDRVKVRTTETDKSTGEIVSYTAVCKGVVPPAPDGHWTFLLSYEREEGENADLADGWLFGESIIVMEKLEDGAPTPWKVIALWIGEDDTVDGVERRCEVFTGPIRRTYERLVRAGQQAFRAALIGSGGGPEKCSCEISGFVGTPVLDAAHVVSFELDPCPADPANGLLMRADLHRLYDRNVLRISETGEISLTKDWARKAYPDLRGKLSAKTFERVKDALARRAQMDRDSPERFSSAPEASEA